MQESQTYMPQLSVNDVDFREVIRIGSDVCITESLMSDFHFPEEFQVRDYMVLYIRKGSIQGKTNGEDTYYSAPMMVILQPHEVYSFREASDDVEGSLITYSKEFSEQLNILHEFQLSVALREQTALLLDEDAQRVMQDYYTQIRRIATYQDNPFQREAALHMTRAFFYGIGCYYYHAKRATTTTRQQQLAEQFLTLIEQHGARERKLEFYAEQLHLSAKYIASVVQKETGRAVSYWIEQAVLREAKRLLTETNKTVQQISDELQFRDQAYFGAYFKRLTGVSPKNYRTTI